MPIFGTAEIIRLQSSNLCIGASNKANNMEKVIFKMPSWCLDVIFNDNQDNLSEQETEKINDFLAELHNELGQGFFSFDQFSQEYFSHSNELENLGGNCFDLVYTYQPKI